jgi:ABC-type ATPase with predicted acetyltransferase domain
MITDLKNASDLDLDNNVPVTLDDLSEEDRREFERGIEEEKAARLKQYFKTRSGSVKKVTEPNPPSTLGTKVITQPKISLI